MILLLKEFKDVFAWDYNEILGLDHGLVVHTLNVDPEAKPMAQLARILHTKIEEQRCRNYWPQYSLNPSNTRISYPTWC